MMPTQPIVDMMRRTICNLEYIERHKTDDGPYEVTQLVSSFLGALAHPWENFRSDLKKMSMADAKQRGWPELRKGRPSDADPTSLGDLIRLVRNAFAHGNVKFHPGPDNEIGSIDIWNNWKGQRTWGTTLRIVDLRTILQCFVELAEEIHADPRITKNRGSNN